MLQILGENRLSALFEKVDKSSASVGLNTRCRVVVQYHEEGRNHLWEGGEEKERW